MRWLLTYAHCQAAVRNLRCSSRDPRCVRHSGERYRCVVVGPDSPVLDVEELQAIISYAAALVDLTGFKPAGKAQASAARQLQERADSVQHLVKKVLARL